MSETTPTSDYTLRPGEEGYIQDPGLAHDMAKAELPHREDALALGELKQRAMNVLGELQEDREGLGFSGSKPQVKAQMDIAEQRDYVSSLEKAQQRSTYLAVRAADKVQQSEDPSASK
ncbi:hypothetical protein KDA11_01320 [Candidatus Saccharibacteria bacterium]|nr:hypothetical protein [Candidatus Saccharibacteria bacterium]